jgi:competence protein ComEA
MPIRPEGPERAAVARRLDLLDRELAAVRGGDLPAEPADPAPAPAPLPVPGRHAARRPRTGADDWVPEPLRGRVALGPGPLAVVAVVVALGLGVTAWWALRSEPVPVAPPEPVAAVSPLAEPAAEASPTAGSQAEPDTVTVDVTGKVRRPGIVVLETGARVVDALEEAGGARPGVDLSGLNLARVLVDGEQVVVGVPPPATGLPAAPAAPAPGAPGTALVDLNTADLTLLETLPDVGPVTAQAILTWRDEHGGFTAVSELLEVDGIGDATLATITPFVTV